jgi:hypothetical protein
MLESSGRLVDGVITHGKHLSSAHNVHVISRRVQCSGSSADKVARDAQAEEPLMSRDVTNRYGRISPTNSLLGI